MFYLFQSHDRDTSRYYDSESCSVWVTDCDSPESALIILNQLTADGPPNTDYSCRPITQMGDSLYPTVPEL